MVAIDPSHFSQLSAWDIVFAVLAILTIGKLMKIFASKMLTRETPTIDVPLIGSIYYVLRTLF